MNFAIEWGGGAAGAALAAAVAAAFVWHARRAAADRALLFLRALACAVVAAALLRPSVALREAQTAKPRVLVLIDHGHAMAAVQRGAKSRLQAAQEWLLERRKALEERCEVRLYALCDRGRRIADWEELKSLQAAAAGFHPGAALRDVIDDLGGQTPRPERAWLFSDGNAESDSDLEKAVAEMNMPLDVVGVGPARRERGMAFADIKAPDFAFLHGRVEVEAAVEASALAGRAVELSLWQRARDASQDWQALERRRLTVRSDFETVAATFTAAAQSLGSQRYRLEARVAGERAVAAREFRVEVIRQKYRIMYLSGRPSAEYANLREFLKSDPNHELVSFVILRNPENPTYVPDSELSLIPFPADEIFVQTLPQFDLFILENFSYVRFHLPVAYLNSLKNFVASGGALLVIGGENAFSLGGYRGTPLEDVLPVTLSQRIPDFVPGAFRAKPAVLAHPMVQLYDTAQESSAAWESLPELDGYAQFVSVRPGTTVLAAHPQARTESGEPQPVFAIREYGRGKVMLASTDSTWRWRLGAAMDWRAAGFYGRFWTRAVQYLTGNLELSKVKFAPLPDRLAPREPAVLSLRVFDEGFQPAAAALTSLKVLWSPPGAAAREIVPRETSPGCYTLELTGLAPGWQRVKAVARYRGRPWGEDEARFEWAKAAPEAPMDRKWLRRAAESSPGGAVTELTGLRSGALLEKLSPVRRRYEITRRRVLWASPWWLGLAAALFLCEWAWRRWRGFP